MSDGIGSSQEAAYSVAPEAGPSKQAAMPISASFGTTQMNGGLRAIKMGYQAENDQHIYVNGSHSMQEEQKPVVKADSGSPQPSGRDAFKAEPDVASFLRFETEDDKKVKIEQAAADGPGSRNDSPNLNEEDEDEEDQKSQRRPGAPVSIAHLPLAEEEVRVHGPIYQRAS